MGILVRFQFDISQNIKIKIKLVFFLPLCLLVIGSISVCFGFFWNSDNMKLSGNLLNWCRFPLLIAPSFGPGDLDKILREYRRVWQRLL